MFSKSQTLSWLKGNPRRRKSLRSTFSEDQSQAVAAQMESLEPRTVMAAAVGATLKNGILYIEGTEGNDKIFVRQKGNVISIDGVKIQGSGTVNEIQVNALGGDDIVRLDGNGKSAEAVKVKSIVWGGDGNDKLVGGKGSDQLQGNRGDDLIYGMEGNDALFGQENKDTIYGGADNDELLGGTGNDDLSGDSGNDRLFGEDGKDTLYGGSGNDEVVGGNNNDTLYGNENSDTLWGFEGDDYLDGGTGNDFLRGNEGFDTLKDGSGVDQFFANLNEDTLSDRITKRYNFDLSYKSFFPWTEVVDDLILVPEGFRVIKTNIVSQQYDGVRLEGDAFFSGRGVTLSVLLHSSLNKTAYWRGQIDISYVRAGISITNG